MRFHPLKRSVLPNLLLNVYAEKIMTEFDWREYVRLNPDLGAACCTQDTAKSHFIFVGYSEGRLISENRIAALDIGYYRAKYPELNLETDAEAQLHYAYFGYYENRFNNADAEWIYSTDLHIFQMGRVGSHSISRSLEKCYPGKVLHLHWLTDISLAYPQCLIPYSKILVHDRPHPLKVISASREIVSRVLSGIFQYLDNGVDSIHYDQFNDFAEEHFFAYCETISTWFDHHYFCDLDIYSSGCFDHNERHLRVTTKDLDLLVYRQEDLGSIAHVIQSFLGLEQFEILRENDSSQKYFQETHKKIMREFTVPSSVLQDLYATRYMQFFYTDDERSRFFSYWTSMRP